MKSPRPQLGQLLIMINSSNFAVIVIFLISANASDFARVILIIHYERGRELNEQVFFQLSKIPSGAIFSFIA